MLLLPLVIHRAFSARQTELGYFFFAAAFLAGALAAGFAAAFGAAFAAAGFAFAASFLGAAFFAGALAAGFLVVAILDTPFRSAVADVAEIFRGLGHHSGCRR